MKNYFIKGQRFMPAFVLSVFMLLSFGFAGSAQAHCCNGLWPTGLFDLGFLRTGLGGGCCPTVKPVCCPVVRQPVCCPQRVSRTYWTNWQPYYHYRSCDCPVRCQKSCLVSRCSGKVIRCVTRCNR